MPLRAISWVAVSTTAQAEDERASIPAQLADNEAIAAKLGLQITDTLIVPGHSRRYLDIHELAHDARAQGIDAFDKLLAHFHAKDFDVLLCRDGDRFARSQALHAYIVESVISVGARIYSLADGWVDEQNYRMMIAMGGYRAAGEIDNFVKRSLLGKRKRAERGIPLTQPPISHIIERDELGKPVRVILRPGMERFWQDLARLLVQGNSWHLTSKKMKELGHRHPKTGAVMLGHHFARAIQNPFVWGKSFYGAIEVTKHNTWPFNPNQQPPAGCIPIERPVLPIPVVYPNEIITYDEHGRAITLTELKKVLIDLEAGDHQLRERSYALSGLLVCGGCGWFLRHKSYKNKAGDKIHQYTCSRADRGAGLCEVKARINADDAQEFIDTVLQWIIHVNDIDNAVAAMFGAGKNQGESKYTPDNRLELLARDIQRSEDELKGLLRDRAKERSPRQLAMLESMITELESTLDNLEAQRRNLQRSQPGAYEQAATALTLAKLKELDLTEFWNYDPLEINRVLSSLFGKKRFIVKDHRIVDFK